MTKDQLLEWCKIAGKVGETEHTDFVNYVIPLSSRKKTDDGWQSVENPYMMVDGRVVMARADHRIQNKKLHINPPTVLTDNNDQLTLMVTIESECYGKACGIATSRRVGGTPSEREYSWETAETSAVGRALAEFGYGVFPGTGLTSADDIKRMNQRQERQEKEQARVPAPTGSGNVTKDNGSIKPTSQPKQIKSATCPKHLTTTILWEKNGAQKWYHKTEGGEDCYAEPEKAKEI